MLVKRKKQLCEENQTENNDLKISANNKDFKLISWT
jgi:hypothetical protein